MKAAKRIQVARGPTIDITRRNTEELGLRIPTCTHTGRLNTNQNSHGEAAFFKMGHDNTDRSCQSHVKLLSIFANMLGAGGGREEEDRSLKFKGNTSASAEPGP